MIRINKNVLVFAVKCTSRTAFAELGLCFLFAPFRIPNFAKNEWRALCYVWRLLFLRKPSVVAKSRFRFRGFFLIECGRKTLPLCVSASVPKKISAHQLPLATRRRVDSRLYSPHVCLIISCIPDFVKSGGYVLCYVCPLLFLRRLERRPLALLL